jgi:hypothetical protein
VPQDKESQLPHFAGSCGIVFFRERIKEEKIGKKILITYEGVIKFPLTS